MTKTPELDRAIVEGRKAEAKTLTFVMLDVNRPVFAFERNYARALIASVWGQVAMARKPYSKTKGADYNAGVAVGFETALLELRKFSIVEGEAIEPLPADFAKVWDDNPEGLYES